MPESRPRIHPTAIVGGECQLGEGVEVGPYCVLEGRVKLDDGVRLISHVCLQGPIEIGARTVVYPHSSLGFPPQDVKFKPGHATAGVRIGRDCQLRENVTIHAASKTDAPTSLGDRCFLMVSCHLGHDTRVGDDVTLVNNVLLAGHVEVESNVTMGGSAAVHQFCRIGRLAFVSGLTAVSMDIPPFCISAERNRIQGLNLVGLRRAGVPREQITALRAVFRRAFQVTLPRPEQIAVLEEAADGCPPAREMAEFLRKSKRPIAGGMARPPRSVVVWMQRRLRGEMLEGADDESLDG